MLPCVATFIVPERGERLTRHAEALRSALPQAGALRWLGQGTALDIEFAAEIESLPGLRMACLDLIRNGPVDAIFQPRLHRRKKLLLADMDSTMIGQECIDELADFVGLKPLVAAITERAMRGELAFEPALRERVALLKGLPVSVVDDVLQDRITLTPGGRTLVRTMRAHGAWCELVSGGFTLFTAPVAAADRLR